MLRKPDEEPLSDECSLAFGIRKTRAGQNHVALIYKNEQSKTMLLHHGWHRETYSHEWDRKYYSAQFQNLDIELQETFADWAAEVAHRLSENTIPYGVFYNLKANFDSDGRYVDRNDYSGHTCATFLLDLFYSYQLPLLDLMSWPQDRDGDAVWQRNIINALLADGAIESINVLAQYAMKLRRFRPEEVASAALLYVDSPLSFDAVQAPSKLIADAVSAT